MQTEGKFRKLAIPRPSHTSQGLLLDVETPRLSLIEDCGDIVGKDGMRGKPPGYGLAGGSGETIFTLVMNGERFPDLTEKDLMLTHKIKPVTLAGDTIDVLRTLNYLLKQYEFGTELPMTYHRINGGFVANGRNGNGHADPPTMEDAVIIPERDETPAETVVRETFMETGHRVRVIPSKFALSLGGKGDIRTAIVGARCSIVMSRFGEVVKERSNDKNDRSGRPFGHTCYVFHLEREEGPQERIQELDEVKTWVWKRLDEVVEMMLLRPTARTSKEGLYDAHIRRIDAARELLDLDWSPFYTDAVCDELDRREQDFTRAEEAIAKADGAEDKAPEPLPALTGMRPQTPEEVADATEDERRMREYHEARIAQAKKKLSRQDDQEYRRWMEQPTPGTPR